LSIYYLCVTYSDTYTLSIGMHALIGLHYRTIVDSHTLSDHSLLIVWHYRSHCAGLYRRYHLIRYQGITWVEKIHPERIAYKSMTYNCINIQLARYLLRAIKARAPVSFT